GASMEPWFGNHGNIGLKARESSSSLASMEPWFGNHGNSTRPEAGQAWFCGTACEHPPTRRSV
ncbi:MAG TPA: hypothetical protein PLP42_14315, partial [Acidobacteriota bacterium]|nr:hypothetical protein [Acidobacteriota bacterium]